MGNSVRLSKRLAYVLRHHPGSICIELDAAGWVAVGDLLDALSRDGPAVTRADLDAVLEAPGKRRYELRDGRIRAMQGHSVAVDLGLEPTEPPAVLFHGTVDRFLAAIEREGLRAGSRQHVHLSGDVATAKGVGGRRGRAVVLEVDAGALHAVGHRFLLAANGVWLTDHVPPEHLRRRHDGTVSGRAAADP